jgi:hypothetical protein
VFAELRFSELRHFDLCSCLAAIIGALTSKPIRQLADAAHANDPESCW